MRKELSKENKGVVGKGKMLFWNFAGLHECESKKKLWEKYDIISCVETWVPKENELKLRNLLSDDFVWWTEPAVKNNKGKRGRASGGQPI